MNTIHHLKRQAMYSLGGAAIWILSGLAGARQVTPSDLAILLEPSPSENSSVRMKSELFPNQWWQASLALYEKTPVGKALTIENTLEEWQVVSLRIAPCQPLIPILTNENDRFCATELRIVWQPIVFSRPGSWVGVADDRAFHVSYRLDGRNLLTPTQAETYKLLLEKGQSRITQAPSQMPLGQEEIETYEKLHRELVARLLDEVKELSQTPLDGAQITIRPEYASEKNRKAFVEKLEKFLGKHARADQVIELTGFSLTEGRDPPMLDEWIFIALEPDLSQGEHNGTKNLIPKDIRLKSKHSGQELLNFGPHTTVSMHRDDDRIYDLMETLDEAEKLEVEKAVILKFGEKKIKKNMISNVKETQVPHTSCASCHKLNSQPFDFHNLSYYLDHPMTISPRVVQDVTHDLSWLKKQGID